MPTEIPWQGGSTRGAAENTLIGVGRELLESAGFPVSVRPDHIARDFSCKTKLETRWPEVSNVLALIATRNYITFAKLTARTFLNHHPEFEAFLLIVDGEPADAALFAEGRVVLLRDLGLEDSAWYSAKFGASHFSNALKPTFLKYLSQFASKAIYLDCDIAVFSRMSEMLSLLDTKDLVLIPHMLTPAPRPDQFHVHPNRADTYCAGLINGGCLGIKLEACADFFALWEEMNFAPGAFYGHPVPQTDQQHLNWALVLVPGAEVLRSTRYNVAYWNLHERNFRLRSKNGDIPEFEVDGQPLAFFHFSGYDVANRWQISLHDGRHSVYNFPGVAEILSWYSDAILACPTADLLHEPYRFDQMANGFFFTPFIRDLLKRYEEYAPRVDVQSVDGAAALCSFLMDPLPASGSLLPLVAAEIYEMRPELRALFPGAHTAFAPKTFLAWFFRHAGLEHNIQFLIDRFRRALTSDALLALAAEVSATLGNAPLKFLGAERMAAIQRLQTSGRLDLAEALLDARYEGIFVTDVQAALTLYLQRAGLEEVFPDIVGRSHEEYLEWLLKHASHEHGLHAKIAEQFSGRTAAACLPRIFSFIARHEDLAEDCAKFLLADDPDPIFRRLLRAAGEGYEFDIEDVVVLRFVHQTSRHLLVPLYLETPFVRRSLGASRLARESIRMLPKEAQDTAWARRGCEIHAAHFNKFDAVFDAEARRWGARLIAPASDVLELLRTPRVGQDPIKAIEPVYRVAARLAPAEAATKDLQRLLEERKTCPGVNVFGYFSSDIGVGESARGLSAAISLLRPINRVPYGTHQLQVGTKLQDLFQRYDYLSDTNVFVTYPHQREDLLGGLRPDQKAGRRNIAHLAWEQRDANPWWKAVYDRYDEIWTISEFCAAPFRSMFADRVKVVPNVLSIDQFPGDEDFRASRLAGEKINFLFAFDAGSSMERKNPEAVIEAFSQAFKGTQHAKRVHLTLKVGCMLRPQYASAVARLRRSASASGLSISFDGRQLDRPSMLRLIASADCYVSLHRSEGFGYTMAEAMFYGIPVIASDYSGNLEYMNATNSFLVPCREVFVKNAEGPFQRGSVWGDPDLAVAADLMRRVIESPAQALAVGKSGKESVLRKLTASAVAAAIKPSFEISYAHAELDSRQAQSPTY